tara:strand:- start:1313 stop:1753 length:441 start_codon:yes stop_codon:yes gene_type:complete
MDLKTLQADIMREEGVKYEIYNDHLGYKTFGVGHLCRATDPENEMEVGTKVSKIRVAECFEADLYVAINDAETFCEGMDIDDNVKECVTHMSFQLGLPKLNQFKKFKKALQDNNIETAIIEMKDSRAYNQTTNRWDRLIEKMRKSL